jgi:hypothetical protein
MSASFGPPNPQVRESPRKLPTANKNNLASLKRPLLRGSMDIGRYPAYPVACQNGVLRMSFMRVPICWDMANSKAFTLGTQPDRHGRYQGGTWVVPDHPEGSGKGGLYSERLW